VRPIGDDPALLHDDDALRHFGDHAHVVFDEQYRATARNLPDQCDGPPHVLEAHPGRRLVQQEEARLAREGDRELERALLTVGEVARQTIRGPLEADLAEQLPAARPASSRRSTPFTARNPANFLVTPRVSTANPSVRARIGLRIVRRVVKGGIDLTGRSAIVTGGASGIGRAIAMDFADHGARVLVADLDERQGTQLASSIGGIFRRADVSKREDCRALVDAAVGELGGVDILVNNAGLQHVAPIEEFPEERWEYLIQVMLLGAFYLTK